MHWGERKSLQLARRSLGAGGALLPRSSTLPVADAAVGLAIKAPQHLFAQGKQKPDPDRQSNQADCLLTL